jgi:hypothetical protein
VTTDVGKMLQVVNKQEWRGTGCFYACMIRLSVMMPMIGSEGECMVMPHKGGRCPLGPDSSVIAPVTCTKCYQELRPLDATQRTVYELRGTANGVRAAGVCFSVFPFRWRSCDA